MKKIFETKRKEAKREWRKLHTKKLHDLYSSPILLANSKWDGQDLWHVSSTGYMQKEIWWGNLKGTDNLKDLGINGRIIKSYLK
jgi:hypothetical protein